MCSLCVCTISPAVKTHTGFEGITETFASNLTFLLMFQRSSQKYPGLSSARQSRGFPTDQCLELGYRDLPQHN